MVNIKHVYIIDSYACESVGSGPGYISAYFDLLALLYTRYVWHPKKYLKQFVLNS